MNLNEWLTQAMKQHNPKDWEQVKNRRKRGKAGKNTDQANLTLHQVNLTSRSYVKTTRVPPTTTLAQPQLHTQQKQITNSPLTIMEVMVVCFSGAILLTIEQAVRKRRPDAIIREVKANMSHTVARPLSITMGK